MKSILIAMMMVFSVGVFADSVGINYADVQPQGGAVATHKIEFLGAKTLTDQIDGTVKAVLSNAHSSPGYGTALEVGTKIKFASSKDQFVPWVQPALTFTSPETAKGNYFGYVVDAGVDSKFNRFTVTPAVSYGDSFNAANHKQSTAGVKVAYAYNDNLSFYSRYRREFNDVGLDANRIYIGTEYKF